MAGHEIERRTGVATNTVEYRDDGKTAVIRGYAAVFESDSRNLGGFIETIHRRAFDRVLATKPDVVGVYNHDKNYLLGRTGNGTMTLSVDEYGLRYEIQPPATRADVVESVSRGDVVGSSFAFAVSDGGDVWSRDTSGIRRREIREIGLLDDVGPVVRPAYDSSSVVVSRRALEIALGDAFRPNQTMANAAKRGLKLAERNDYADQRLLGIAERIASRDIVSPEDVSYLSEVFVRCEAAKKTSWTGTPAWIEWQLAGGDSGFKWIQRRSEPQTAVQVPAEAAEERAEVSLTPTAGMRSACRRGLKLYEDGRGGDGLVGETVSWARKIAAGEALTEQKVVKMRAWHARHAVDKKAGWDKPGEETPGFVAFLLWAGEPGRRFAEAKVKQLEAAGKRELPEMEDGEYDESYHGTLSPANLALASELNEIADEYGKWPTDAMNAHYMEESPFRSQGLVCKNCVFWQDGGGCDIVQGEIAEDGVCKLNVIPEEKMTSERSEAAVVEAPEAPTAVTPETEVPPAEPAKAPEPDYTEVVAAMQLASLKAALANHLHGDIATK